MLGKTGEKKKEGRRRSVRYACPDGEGKKKNGAREKLEGGGGRAEKGGKNGRESGE